MSLLDRARHYYEECDMNCAETIFAAADDEYALLDGKEARKLMAGFGGGAGIEHLCGALSGAVAAIGAALTEDRAHRSPRVKETCREFLTRWESSRGPLLCARIKERYREEDENCLNVVMMAAELLEEVLGESIQDTKSPEGL
ncbi:MAG: C-GCAxxG-C-C family (seleno)protein [Thermovirgaceae bacterium]